MERRRMNCVVSRELSDKLKEWALSRDIRCFRSEYYDEIYVEMDLTADEVEEVDSIIDEYYKAR